MNIAANAFCRPLKQGTAQLAVELGTLRSLGSRHPVQHRLQIGAADRLDVPFTLLQPVDDEVACHTPKPAAKRSAFLGWVPAVDAPADREKQFLHDPCVRILQPVLPQQSVRHGRTDSDELHPGLMILRVAQTKQQAGTG
jgi:hypothetical protein